MYKVSTDRIMLRWEHAWTVGVFFKIGPVIPDPSLNHLVDALR
jgi:hypothetical protein